jgi:hypothetical protein
MTPGDLRVGRQRVGCRTDGTVGNRDAQYETEVRAERVLAGIAVARERGVRFGRREGIYTRLKVTDEQAAQIRLRAGWLLCPHASGAEQVPVPAEGFLEDVGGVLPGRGQESPPEVLPERRAKVRVGAVLDDPLGPLLR